MYSRFIPRNGLYREAFIILFRHNAKRFNTCLAEVYRIGLDNVSLLGCEYIETIKSIHDVFMTNYPKDDDNNRHGDVDEFVEKTDRDSTSFAGQWNRVVAYIVAYEKIFGEDPELIERAKKWEEAQNAREQLAKEQAARLPQ